MVHQPPILILDEPTAGVDVELRNNLWENVKKLNKEGCNNNFNYSLSFRSSRNV